MSDYDTETDDLGGNRWMVTIDANINDGPHRFIYTVTGKNEGEAVTAALKALKKELTAFVLNF